MKILLITWVASSFYIGAHKAVECVKSFDSRKEFVGYLNKDFFFQGACQFIEGRSEVFSGDMITKKVIIHKKSVTRKTEVIERYELKK